jgi:UDP-GlcNAc3NAcA epimerase
MKILTVVGARPQFIKAAAVSREIGRIANLTELIVHTGQHFDDNMSDVFFRDMQIPAPAYHLNINSLTHGAMTGQMLIRLEEIFLSEKPDMVMVYGDTNSTLAGALAAAKLHIPVAHVEAGLRSFRMSMPEEINRVMTDRIASLLFCPTDTAVANLQAEGVERSGAKIVKCGDVMYDCALYYGKIAAEKSTILHCLKHDRFALCTVHRAENTDDAQNLKAILAALDEINAELPVILPIHPRTRKIIESLHLKTGVTLLDPVSYFDMLQLLQKCEIVLTDSGGLQKEAYFFSKPCVTLRDETEWVELVEAGANRVTGAKTSAIVAACREIRGKKFSLDTRLYGDGNAAQRIAEVLEGK